MKFTDALDRSAEDIVRPPQLPLGHYLLQVKGPAEIESFTSKKTGDDFDRVEFALSCVEAQDDVDPDDLEAFGPVAGQTLRRTFLFNTTDGKEADFDRSMYNFKRFLVDHLGLPEEGSMEELMASAPGMQCLGRVGHRPDPNDPEIVYAEIDRTASA